MSALEETLMRQLALERLPAPAREHRWAAELLGSGKGLRERLTRAGLRDWRFDAAWPTLKLAVEVEGGGWSGGRHTRGAGFAADLEKYHHAMAHGWTVYRCDGRLIRTGEAAKIIRILWERLDAKGNTPS
jgi:hypothetical protein